MNIMVLERLLDSFLGSYAKPGNSDATNNTDQDLDNVWICRHEQLIKSGNVK